MGEREAPSAAEWKVLGALWRLRGAASRDVVDAVAAANGWQPSTVKTLLRRLVAKGHLRARRVGNSFLYEAAEEPLPALARAFETLLDHAQEGMTAPLLAHLVRRSRLSREDVAALRALLDAKNARGR